MKNPSTLTCTRLLKCGISLGVFAATNLQTLLARLLGRDSRGTCVVLDYHSLPPDQCTRFAEQLDTLLQLAEPIDVSTDIQLRSGVRYAGVTFDDAFENFVHQALPELEKRNMPATLFVISDALDKAFGPAGCAERVDRKSTRLNSSHVKISYAVFCLKKKNPIQEPLDYRGDSR